MKRPQDKRPSPPAEETRTTNRETAGARSKRMFRKTVFKFFLSFMTFHNRKNVTRTCLDRVPILHSGSPSPSVSDALFETFQRLGLSARQHLPHDYRFLSISQIFVYTTDICVYTATTTTAVFPGTAVYHPHHVPILIAFVEHFVG